MIIKLGSVRSDNYEFSLSKYGDILEVNGEQFDFSRIGEGDTLPYSALSGSNQTHFDGDITRENGEIVVTIIFPYGPQAGPAQMFPETMYNVPDGPVQLPSPEPDPETEEITTPAEEQVNE